MSSRLKFEYFGCVDLVVPLKTITDPPPMTSTQEKTRLVPVVSLHSSWVVVPISAVVSVGPAMSCPWLTVMDKWQKKLMFRSYLYSSLRGLGKTFIGVLFFFFGGGAVATCPKNLFRRQRHRTPGAGGGGVVRHYILSRPIKYFPIYNNTTGVFAIMYMTTDAT